MARIRNIARGLLLVLLSASVFFNSPSLAELDFCVGPGCCPKGGHAAVDPCETAANASPEPSLHSREEEGRCGSCIRLSLLHQAGESTRPAPGLDGMQSVPSDAWVTGPDFHPTASSHRLSALSPPGGNPQLLHVRTVRLLI